jgi:hypothetical protein
MLPQDSSTTNNFPSQSESPLPATMDVDDISHDDNDMLYHHSSSLDMAATPHSDGSSTSSNYNLHTQGSSCLKSAGNSNSSDALTPSDIQYSSDQRNIKDFKSNSMKGKAFNLKSAPHKLKKSPIPTNNANI